MTGGICQLCFEIRGGLLQIDFLQELFDGFRTHSSFKVILILFPHITVFLFSEHLLFLQLAHIAGIRDNIHSKIENLFQHTGRNVENKTYTGRNPLQIPDMGNRRSQLNVAHSFPAHFGTGNFHTTAITNFPFIPDSLILSAVALPILSRPKDAFTEKAVPFWFQSAVVDRLRLFNLTVRPFSDFFGRSKSDLYRFKYVKLHRITSSSFTRRPKHRRNQSHPLRSRTRFLPQRRFRNSHPWSSPPDHPLRSARRRSHRMA